MTNPAKSPTSDDLIQRSLTVSRGLSPAHAIIWLATRICQDRHHYADVMVSNMTGIGLDAVRKLTAHLIVDGHLDQQDFPALTPLTLPPIRHSLDAKSQHIFDILTESPNIHRALNIANVPAARRHLELERVAQLAADDDVKNPVRYAQRIILNQEVDHGSDPDTRRASGRTPVEPG
jgi:hypothetical protein